MLHTPLGALPMRPREHQLLATLSAAGGTRIGFDELEQLVWSRNQDRRRLFTTCHRLRRFIGDEAGSCVITDAPAGGYALVGERVGPWPCEVPEVPTARRVAIRALVRAMLTHDRIWVIGAPGTGRADLVARIARQARSLGCTIAEDGAWTSIRGAERRWWLRVGSPHAVPVGAATLSLSPVPRLAAARHLRSMLEGTPRPAMDVALALIDVCGGLWTLLGALAELWQREGPLSPCEPLLSRLWRTPTGAHLRGTIEAEWRGLPATIQQARIDWVLGRGEGARTGWPTPVPLPLAATVPLPPGSVAHRCHDLVSLQASLAHQEPSGLIERLDEVVGRERDAGRGVWGARVCEIAQPHLPERDRVKGAFLVVEALRSCGEISRALGWLEGVEPGSVQERLGLLLLRLSLLDRLARYPEALAVAREASALGREHPELDQALIEGCLLGVLPHHTPIAEIEHHLRAALESTDPVWRVSSWLTFAHHLVVAGELVRVGVSFERALAEDLGASTELLRPRIIAERGVCGIGIGQIAAGRRDVSEGIRLLKAQGQVGVVAYYRLWIALLDAEAGLLRDARLACHRSAGELSRLGWGYATLADRAAALLGGERVDEPACAEWFMRAWWRRMAHACASSRARRASR